ncbi:MAG: hypothetical protein FWF05_09450 [Oscillospiraceae bacterium]|nr:hypothetical protein [Oscillospiraceae bacterium]
MSTKTNTGLVAYCEAQLGLSYWRGTFGQVAAPDLLNQKAKQYPERYSAARQATAKAKHIGLATAALVLTASFPFVPDH